MNILIIEFNNEDPDTVCYCRTKLEIMTDILDFYKKIWHSKLKDGLVYNYRLTEIHVLPKTSTAEVLNVFVESAVGVPPKRIINA